MGEFAFIVHPLHVSDIYRKLKIARYLPDPWVESLMKFMPPLKAARITGIKSSYGSADGWFVGCPLTPRQMMSLPQDFVLKKISDAARAAQDLGAKIVGLGAFTKVVGDGGIAVAKTLKVPVTTGNSYTVATALEGTRLAAQMMGKDISSSEITVLGATGSIGAACAQILAREASSLTLVARNTDRLERLARIITQRTGLAPRITKDVKSALRGADIVITVTSSVDTVIEPEDLKTGAVVCDVARPRDVSRRVKELRNDVLVIEGGVVEVPGEPDLGMDFGFPPRTVYACMAETMILAMEERYESFTLGKEITVEQVDEIGRLAKKHGFKLAGLRSFDRALEWEDIQRIRAAAG